MSATYSKAQVAEHNKKENGWFIINNSIYDVTKFYDDHPGGRDVLLANIGKDATDEFEAVHHSKGAYKMMAKYCIGDLDLEERKAFVNRKVTGDQHATTTTVVHVKSEDESLLGRIQEQLQLFIVLALFVMAGVFLLS